MKKDATQARSRKTVKTILEAALQILIDHGYEKATTNRIADRSGFGVGTLYQYFEDKEDIYRELVTRELERIVGTLESSEIGPTLDITIAAVIRLANETARDNPGTFHALEPLLAGSFRSSRTAARERCIKAMVRILRHHEAEIAVDDVEMAARVVITVGEGFAISASPDYFSSTELEDHAAQLVIASLTSA